MFNAQLTSTIILRQFTMAADNSVWLQVMNNSTDILLLLIVNIMFVLSFEMGQLLYMYLRLSASSLNACFVNNYLQIFCHWHLLLWSAVFVLRNTNRKVLHVFCSRMAASQLRWTLYMVAVVSIPYCLIRLYRINLTIDLALVLLAAASTLPALLTTRTEHHSKAE